MCIRSVFDSSKFAECARTRIDESALVTVTAGPGATWREGDVWRWVTWNP